MAAIETHRTTPAALGPFGRIGGLIATAFAKISAWNDARVTRNALSSLSDRELEDIGLIRGDIDMVANGIRHY